MKDTVKQDCEMCNFGVNSSFWPWRSFLCQQLWATLMDDTPSLVSIGSWRSQWLQNDYWVMAVRHGQFRPFHKVWLLRDDCMKFHKVRTNLAKTWQNMTQMLLNVALFRAHVHLLFLVATGGKSQNTGSCRGLPIFCDVYIFEKLDPNVSKCESNIICKWAHHQSWETTSPWPYQDVMSDECVLCI